MDECETKILQVDEKLLARVCEDLHFNNSLNLLTKAMRLKKIGNIYQMMRNTTPRALFFMGQEMCHAG